MSDYLSPRRFARMSEMDRNGFPAAGTLADQGRVRDAIDAWIEWDGGFDRALYALDLEINRMGRSYLVFSFYYETQPKSLRAHAWPMVIQIFPNVGKPGHNTLWEYVVLHEMGHWMGMWLLEPADWSERWAVDFQGWVMSGAEPFGRVYERLDAVGAQDTVIVREGNIE